MSRIAQAIPGLGGAAADAPTFALPALEVSLGGGIVRGLAALGSTWFLATAAVLAALLAIRRGGILRPGIYLAGTTLGGFALERGVQVLARRVGPAGREGLPQWIDAATGASTSSGHIVAAVALYGGIAFAVSRISRSWKLRVCTWAAAVVVVILAGAGRVRLGDDLASGVVAAGALGALWLAVASTAWLLWDRLGEHPRRRQARDRVVGSTLRWGIVVVSLGVALHVLLYRFVSFWLPVLAGIPVYLGVGRRSSAAAGSRTGTDL